MNPTRFESKRTQYARRQSNAKGRDVCTDPNALPVLLELTRDPDAAVWSDAVQYLCPCHVQRNKPEIWDRLFELVTDPDLKVRTTVFHILGDGSPNERHGDVIKATEAMYHGPDLKLHRRVRKFLAQYRRTGKVNIL
jgi:hypothetical protein